MNGEDRYIQNRVNLPTSKSSAEISRDIPAQIRARAFFSARVAEAHILDRFRQITDDYNTGRIGRDEARNLMMEYARQHGRDDGTRGLKNLASTARLNLIIDQNAKMAHAVGEHERMYSPAALKLFPYVRYHASVGSKKPRSAHQKFEGMIFEKTDPWLTTHTPPWEFGCNCRLEQITAKQAGKTPDLIQEPTPADKVTVDSKSGFSFDPAHAFEKFEFDAIKDPGLRENAREGVEKILAENSGMPAGNPAGASGSAPPAGSSSGSGNPPKDKLMNMLLKPDEGKESGHLSYRDKPEEFLKEKAEELKRRVAAESSRKIFPKDPKKKLPEPDFDKAADEARRAVPPEVMDAVDQKIREAGGEEVVTPFLHYSSKPGDSPNVFVRETEFKDGEIDWTNAKIPKDKTPEDLKKAIKDTAALQELLDVMPKFHGTVYRGCSFDSIDDAEKYLNLLFNDPENLKGFISTTPDPVVAHHYAAPGKFKVVVVVPNSRNGVYFGPHSTHPEDEETLISYKFYLKGLKKYEADGILYVLAEEVAR